MSDADHRDSPEMNIAVKHISLPLWRKFRVECVTRDMTVAELLNHILQDRYGKEDSRRQ